MKKKLITSFFVFVLAISTFVVWKNQEGSVLGSTVFAVGDLVIDWGVPSGDPIFIVSHALPGDTESRTVSITNNASSPRPVSVRGDKLSEVAALASVLDFVISENGTDLYGGASTTGPKTLTDFFAETATPSSIPLSVINPGNTTTYTFRAHFQESAGNEYQNAQVIFNLIIGIDSPIPAECAHIQFTGPTIFGTEGNDTIRGTRGNDLVFALEGDDYVTTFAGDDCIVGGAGNDELRGEAGEDVIFGNEGDDVVVGAIGKDLLFGNDGADRIKGENNDDQISGGNGNDTITGGNGKDVIHGDNDHDTLFGENDNDLLFGDDGNDRIDGGNGQDQISGGNGNDIMNGKNGNDTITGNADMDDATGFNGTDTCDAEIEASCEL